MCLEYVEALMRNPLEAIRKAKREKSAKETSVLLAVEALLVGLSLVLLIRESKVLPVIPTSFYLPLLLAYATLQIINILIMAGVITLTFNLLGGRGGYIDAFNAEVFYMFYTSINLILISLLNLSFSTLALPLSFIVSIFLQVIGLSVCLRSIKELFRVDSATLLLGLIVVLLGIVGSIFTLTILSPSLTEILPLMR